MRESGVLMSISSLASNNGIGTFGEEARKFVDFLNEAGQAYWQILPIGPTSYGDSPYQSFSTFAGNPYFIDLDDLAKDGYLKLEEYKHLNNKVNKIEIDYGRIYLERYKVLKLAAGRLKQDKAVLDFYKKHSEWLDDYALFMALKDENGGNSWHEWEDSIRLREKTALENAKARLKTDIEFWKSVQYFFFYQWEKLKAYANEKNVKIIGDLPIYVASDSVDVWSNTHLFELDENLTPINVAGCPPDGFSADGQLWGNPLFRWDVMKEDGYAWWVNRIAFQCKIYDVLRIDHFRGFDSYYSIPFGHTTAKKGKWKKGPGYDLFKVVEEKIGRQNIIAEDLGFLTKSVHNLLKKTKFPGMKVMLFGFDSRDGGGYLPNNYPENSIAYIGTHDNETFIGWLNDGNPEDVEHAKKYLRLNEEEGYTKGAMRTLWASNSNITIVQMQDLLSLDNSARMNTPSTIGCNWKWRIKPNAITKKLAKQIKEDMKVYNRLNVDQ